MTFSHSFFGLCLGESIAVSGTCLTVVAFDAAQLAVELSQETLNLTTLEALRVGDAVNMERALAAGDRLGGHLVTGHVDGVAEVSALLSMGEMTQITLTVPAPLAKYIAQKGSLTVDGVSLTVNAVEANRAQLLIIPHTLQITTLGALSVGARVNVEVDLIARYVERLIETRNP